MARLRLIVGLVVLATLGGCDDATQQGPLVLADREFRGFRDVYPVLMRDCGFHACHGSEERPFRVYGPGRSRLTDDVRALEAITGDEISLSFSIALSMIDAEHPERSLLLNKPLALEAGGYAHGGIDDFGRNVYRTKDDEGYEVIERWVLDIPKTTCDELDTCCASAQLDEEQASLCKLTAALARKEGESACAPPLASFCPPDE
jgi:hypothetical protein